MENATSPVKGNTLKLETFLKSKVVGLLAILVAIMIAVAWFAPIGRQQGVPAAGFYWLIVMLAMITFIAVIGICNRGRVMGILINERNVMSLSRFQTVVWTLIVLSAFFTMAIMRVHYKIDHPDLKLDPLAISIDPKIWMLLGISLTSLIGTPLIHAPKKGKTPVDGVIDKAASDNNVTIVNPNDINDGILYKNPDPSYAQFTDIFEGDELNNTAYMDISKVQMFFFTIILSLTYVVALFNQISTFDLQLNAFPMLQDGFIAILGISHAAYLTNKTIDHTKSE